MKKNKVISRCSFVVGLLLVFTSIFHTLNLNETLIGIKTGDIAPSHARHAVNTWILSAIGILLMGIWLLFLTGDLKKKQKKAWWQAFIIGLTLAIYGAGSWLKNPQELYLLYFLLLGLFLLIPLIVYGRSYWQIGDQKESLLKPSQNSS